MYCVDLFYFISSECQYIMYVLVIVCGLHSESEKCSSKFVIIAARGLKRINLLKNTRAFYLLVPQNWLLSAWLSDPPDMMFVYSSCQYVLSIKITPTESPVVTPDDANIMSAPALQ
jgi:hypothetical protein